MYFQRYRTVSDVFRGIDDVGRLLGRPAQAKHLTDSLKQSLRALVGSGALSSAGNPVLAITWPDPIYSYGQNTLFTDEIRLAGGQNAVTETFPQPYPALTREYVLKLNPDMRLGGSFENPTLTCWARPRGLRWGPLLLTFWCPRSRSRACIFRRWRR